jgi:hypothetical protein
MSLNPVERASGPRAGATRLIARGLREIGRQVIEERAARALSGASTGIVSLLELQAVMAVREDELRHR